jgi:hypothetical protein
MAAEDDGDSAQAIQGCRSDRENDMVCGPLSVSFHRFLLNYSIYSQASGDYPLSVSVEPYGVGPTIWPSKPLQVANHVTPQIITSYMVKNMLTMPIAHYI